MVLFVTLATEGNQVFRQFVENPVVCPVMDGYLLPVSIAKLAPVSGLLEFGFALLVPFGRLEVFVIAFFVGLFFGDEIRMDGSFGPWTAVFYTGKIHSEPEMLIPVLSAFLVVDVDGF